MFSKLAQDKVAEALGDAAVTIRKLAAERDDAVAKVAQYEARDRSTKLAHVMLQKGVTSDPVEKVAQDLLETALTNPSDFADQERAVAMIGPDMGQKIGHVGSRNSDEATGGTSPLESYLLNGAN